MLDLALHETLKPEGSFWTYDLKPRSGDQLTPKIGKMVFYATKPGPANALLPLADKLSGLGADVVLKLDGTAKEIAHRLFPNRLDCAAPNPEEVEIAVTCGHISIPMVLGNITSLRVASPEAKIATVDENFGTTLPLISALESVGISPDIAFIMDKEQKDRLEDRIKPTHKKFRAVVVNNPICSPFYDPGMDTGSVREKLRRDLSVEDDITLIGYIAPPECDYPIVDGLGHNDHVLNLLRIILQNQTKKIGVLYRPHTRGRDYFPEQFTGLRKNIQVICHDRNWWIERGITLHKQLMACDIAFSTNSTMLVENFTAWGNHITPIAVPVDVLLTENLSDLPINTSLATHKLSHSISSAEQFLRDCPEIIRNPKKYKPPNAPQRLKDFGWEDNPLKKIATELLTLL
jgi:hypothetical protein